MTDLLNNNLTLAVSLMEPKNAFLLVGISLVTAWAMMRVKSRYGHRQPIRTSQEQFERIKRTKGLQGNLERLMVDVEQLAKRFAAQLDAKTIMLEKVIDDADDRIQKLQALLEKASTLQDQVVDKSENKAALNVVPSVSPDPDDPLIQAVYQLADSGYDAPKIAEELGEHVGKVELILALRNA